MLFGFSVGEVALIVGAGVALFGPKDIVIIGRAAGRLTGKAVGYIQNARGQLDPILQRSEINTVHKELRETMAQLEAIRHEMRTGMSIMNPGPVTRHVLDHAAPGLPSAYETKETGHPLHGVHQLKSGLPQPLTQTQELQRTSTLEVESALKTMPSTAGTSTPRVGVAPVGVAPCTPESPGTLELSSSQVTSSPEFHVLPISAMDAGFLPPKAEPFSGGADLVSASVVERKVAFEALTFFRQSEP